jgi:uncharacterized protein (DUF2062 family)
MIPARIGVFFTIGISPVKLALSITLSVFLGLFPFFVLPTLLILLSAFVFRLNLPVMLVCNYAVWPLQIILFIPYIKLGNWLFHSNMAGIQLSGVVHALKADFWGALQSLSSVILQATGAWAISSIPAGFILFGIVYYVARAMAPGHGTQPQ